MTRNNKTASTKSKQANPQISIVIPVYNVEKYLEQCIQSIVSQDIGFEKIQLVLVNDGSKDNSGKICQRYADEYPDNVAYIDQENAGVSEARNAGVKKATGDYIGFVDADDYLSVNAISGVMEYFQTAPADVDVATIRTVQFGYYVAERSINERFNFGTTTVDLTDPDWYDVNPRAAPSFIRSSVAKKHYFHKDINLYEDTRYMGEVLSENMKLGVVSKGVYYNRIHNGDDNASLTTGAAKQRRFYMDPPEKVSLFLLENFKGNDKYPPLYFQYVALYEMRWRVFYNPHNPKAILSSSEYKIYRDTNKKILDLVSDEAIASFKLYSVMRRMFLLNMKHSSDIAAKAKLSPEGQVMLGDTVLFDYGEDAYIKITDLHFSKHQLSLEAFLSVPLVGGAKLKLRIDGNDRSDLLVVHGSDALKNNTALMYDSNMPDGIFLSATIPVQKDIVQSIDFTLVANDSEQVISKLRLTSNFRHAAGYDGSYVVVRKFGGFAISPARGNLVIKAIKARIRYMLELALRVLRKVKRICIQMIKTLR